MNKLQNSPTISVVVPLYNEAAGLELFHAALLKQLSSLTNLTYELIYCDDGSTDGTRRLLEDLMNKNNKIKLISLTRNFGKENALTAGIIAAKGDAILMIDGDGQHPVELITKFIEAWQKGARVVVGVRQSDDKITFFKRLGSAFFYKILSLLTDNKTVQGATDFRLIDRSVQQAFMNLQETNRITRGLIDWLGFEPNYIHFKAKTRLAGRASYSSRKLINLATNSFVSLSPKPLYLFGYLGILITLGAFLLGISVFIEQLILNDPLHWKFTGTAMLGILILFLVGIVLMSQGILSLYISHIHSQSKARPLYVVDYDKSVGIEPTENLRP